MADLGAAVLVAVGVGIAVAGATLFPSPRPDRGPARPDRDPEMDAEGGHDTENDQERLMTRVGEEEARLLVHIERVDGEEAGEAPPEDRPGDPASLRE